MNTLRIVTVVGARPQFIKAAAVSGQLRRRATEILVHTGQHYDFGMSQVFFEQLQLPEPDYNLAVGSGPHGQQTGRMLEAIEGVLQTEKPDMMLVYGDTNSTLAGALAAAKLHIPVAHVEAGLRSFNLAMPEEVNRRLTDHISHLLFTPTRVATEQLAREGITQGVHEVGDVMYDVLLASLEAARQHSRILESLDLQPGSYILATIHRAENTDEPARLRAILEAMVASQRPIIFPVHPRTCARIESFGLQQLLAQVRHLEPVGYLDMLSLEEGASAILTDSGGVQKEAYFLGVPCLTVRNETEWVETVEHGWNRLLTTEVAVILDALDHTQRPDHRPPCYGDGQAAQRIASLLAG